MRPRIITVILGFLFCAAGIAIADKVTYDFDRNANFSKYKTFMWMEELQINEPFMKDRIVESVNSQLRFRGLRPVKEGADIVIGANLATEEKQSWETYYSGGGWGWGGGWSETTMRTYEVGTLVVDVFDAGSRKLVWQGTAIDTLSTHPEKRTREYDKGIAKMFRGFPPGFND